MLAVTLFAVVLLIAFAYPSSTFGAETLVQTAQLLPLGSNTCTPLAVSGFTPYVYDGSLHSFEFTVADSSYVAIAATAGNVNIPFNQMSRQGNSSGGVRIHADMPTTPVQNGLTIRITLLSAKGSGQPVCISTVTNVVDISGEPSQVTPTPAPSPKPVPPTTISKPKPTPVATTTKPVTATTTVGKVTGTTATSAALATTQSILKDMCANVGSTRLWFVLLALFAAIVAFVVFGQPQIPLAMRTQEWTAASIVVPFLLLFGFWYFVESCRTSPWVPVIATVIALAGLSAAFWERSAKVPQTTQTVINLPGAKK